MDATIKTAWLEALRSGKYNQGRGRLKTVKGNYCCLGVLACVLRDQFPEKLKETSFRVEEDDHGYLVVKSWNDRSETEIPYTIASLIGLGDEEQTHLAAANDMKGSTWGKHVIPLIEKL